MKLIIVNGSPAAGKTAVTEKLHKTLPMSFRADIDSWRRLINGWRENREESLTLTYDLSIAAIDNYLQSGHDVIVDKAILEPEGILDSLIAVGVNNNAEIHEFILTAEKEIIIKRAKARGFSEGGLLTPKRVIELWDKTQALMQSRTEAIVIDTSKLNSEEVFFRINEEIA